MARDADSQELRVGSLRPEELERLLPLIESYQRLRNIANIERGRNRGFFGRLIPPSPLGALIAAWRSGQAVGFACLYWSLDTAAANETVTVGDLHVEPAERDSGTAAELIEAAAGLAHARGAHAMIWEAEADDLAARELYDSLGATPSSRVRYELAL